MNTGHLSLLGLLCISSVVASTTLSTYLTTNDKTQLRNLFSSASPYKDAVTAYWSLRGLSMLDALPKDTAAVCQTLKSLSTDTAESIFSITEAAALIKCSIKITTDQESTLRAALQDAKVSSLYHAYTALKNLKLAVDAKQVNDALETVLKTDDTPTSIGYSFLLSAALNLALEKRYLVIEDVYAQADVVESKYMQFEGGIYTTSLVIEGSYKLAAAVKKAPTLKPDQVVQLANYLLSRKYVSKIRSAAQLLAGLKTLSSNAFHVPVAISLDSTNALISSTNKKVAVRVSTVCGDSVGKVTLTADSGRHIADNAVVLSKKQLTVTTDPSVFELDFTNVKAPFGFYRVQLTAALAKADAKFVGLKGSVEFKVVTGVKLDGIELGVGDKDKALPTTLRVNHPTKASPLDADVHQKVFMSFYVKSTTTSESMTAHQVFVRLTHKETGQEITFVAMADEGTKQYKFELDVGAKEKDFGSLSGKYEMSLVVGDAVIENPIEWTVADIKLAFLGQSSDDDSASQYKAKPEIKHLFREPEKRPSTAVSNVFTMLCVTPFVVMLLLWAKLGANISNMPMTISAVGFHIGLAGIFFLYYLYWTQLNMFETFKYLAVLGVPTFLFGNQLLSTIASKRKSK